MEPEYFNSDDENRTAVIADAIKEYFDCPDDEITTFVLCCERRNSEGHLSISSVWSAVPHWHLRGFVEELGNHIEQQKNQEALAQMLTRGEEQPE